MRHIISTAVTCLSITAFSQAAGAQGSSVSEGTALEEIVVTAQKREERLQDVPISIAVLGGDALDQSSDRGVADALSRVPGVFAPVTNQGARSGGNAAIAIRGVSSGAVASGTTGYYLDSTSFGRAQNSYVPDANPYDLDRVEVLRGPQGTLYGASALNGVVRVLTKNPDLQNYEIKARGSVQGTDHGDESTTVDAAFNMPLIEDKLAARLVLGYQDMGGWIDQPFKKDANDSEKSNVRLKLAAKPTDNFSVGVTGWISRTDNGAPSYSNDGGRTDPTIVKESSTIDFDNFGLDLGYDTSVVTIKSMSSYIDYTLDASFDGTGLPGIAPNTLISNPSSSDVFTQEIVLNSVGDHPWRWTLGAMYRDAQDDTGELQQPFPANSSDINEVYHVESKSSAVFGELTLLFADGRFELTGGARYFRDKVREWEDSREDVGIPLPPDGLVSIERTFTKTTPRVVLTWHPSTDATVYTSYSKGFRSGLVQNPQITAGGFEPADPDTLTNYEIGGKASALDGRLSFESAVYYIDWQDIQQDTPVPINGQQIPAYGNGKSASGVGVDFAVMYAPLESLILGLNAGWNDLSYDEAVLQGPFVLFPKGSRLANSPETTVGASVNYTMPLGSGGYGGRLSLSGNYTSEQIASTGPILNLVLQPAPTIVPGGYRRAMADSMTLVRVGFAVEAPKKSWTALLYVDNVTNQEGIMPDAFNQNAIAGVAFNSATVIRPRTYGLQLEYKY